MMNESRHKETGTCKWLRVHDESELVAHDFANTSFLVPV